MCLYSRGNNYAGSVRDPFNREILNIFNKVCFAAGHQSAFGVSIVKTDLSELLITLDCMVDSFGGVSKNLLIVDWDNSTREAIESDAFHMASFNEFGGLGLPKAIGRVTITRNAKFYRSAKKTKIYFKGLQFTSFTNIIDYGDTILVRPTLNGASYELIVDNIIYNT